MLQHFLVVLAEHYLLAPLRARAESRDRALTAHWHEWDLVGRSDDGRESGDGAADPGRPAPPPPIDGKARGG